MPNSGYKQLVFLCFSTLVLYGCVCFCRVCPSTNVANNVANLEHLRGCTEIHGNLRIMLIEHQRVKDYSEFDQFVFPELTQINGYLLFYRVEYLVSIGQLFPNLRVIRGVNVIEQVSLVIYSMPHLESISLPNLSYIARGGVWIGYNPFLCLANAVDWKDIGAEFAHVEITQKRCPPCPAECQGHCWDSFTCQKIENGTCHKECLGCKEPNSPTDCIVCKNFNHHGTCVDKCPENTYTGVFNCYTEKECTEKKSFIFRNKCIEDCPPRYETHTDSDGRKICKFCDIHCTKWCATYDTIESVSQLEELQGCTHINNSLVLQIKDHDAEDANKINHALSKSLGLVRYINDYLVIGRNNFIRDLKFLENLTMIEGNNAHENSDRSLFIYENQNLQKLWNFDNFSLTIKKGNFAFHNNPYLCMSEIEKLGNITGIRFTSIDVNPTSNGEMALNCDGEEDQITTEVVRIGRTNVTLAWKRNKTDDVFYYVVYYTEASGDPLSIQTNSQDVCQLNGWQSVMLNNTVATLSNLQPYQQYYYYISTKIRVSSKDMFKSVNTKLYNFTTRQDDPEKPRDFEVIAVDHETINITWKSPRLMNGKLNHYSLSMEEISDSRDLIRKRDYCLNPRRPEIQQPKEDEIIHHIEPSTHKIPDCYKLPEKVDEIELFTENLLHVVRYNLCDKDSQSKYQFDHCKRFYYDTEEIHVNKRSESTITSSKKKSFTFTAKSFRLPPNKNFHVIKNRKHFTLYVFYIQACNSQIDFGVLCSPVLYEFTRTLPKPNANDISHVETRALKGRDVNVTWQAPKFPNGELVAYNILYYRESQVRESEHAQPTTACVTHVKYLTDGGWVLWNLDPGLYTLKLQAVSVAGPGNFTKEYKFEVLSEVFENESMNIFWISFTVILLLILAAASLLVYFRHKRNKATQVFVNINPEYSSIYVEDEWEMDRNNIQIIREIGQGTFGMVHYGLIKSKGLACAIKTVHETASLETRNNFLTEASVMKAFSNAHHVVKLLGVVSKGHPLLVIMEIMERGDLKYYLRSLRDSSQNVTCNEIYRMSIEIADGMSFLAAKKFVHRDLAARNCMVGHDRTVKIGDFGMTRDIYETDYYRKGTRGLLPVRWMAPESLGDGVFSSDSDVWSYGIVLWEIATLAEQPYQGLSNEQVLQFVVSKGQLERPSECPDLLYEIMHACWYWKPYDRPTFGDIVEKLQDHVGQDFKLVSYYHSKEGQEYRINMSGREKTYTAPALGTGDHFYDDHVSDDDGISLYTGSRPSSFLPLSSLSLRSSRLN